MAIETYISGKYLFSGEMVSVAIPNANIELRLQVNVLSQRVATKSATVRFTLEVLNYNNAYYGERLDAACSEILVNGSLVEGNWFEHPTNPYEGDAHAAISHTKWDGQGYPRYLASPLVLWESDNYQINYDENDRANVTVSATFSAEVIQETGSWTGTLGEITDQNYTVNFNLPDLPRYADFASVPASFTDEDNPTVTYSVPNGTTNLQVGILFSDYTIAVPYRTVSDSATSYTFLLTDDERATLYGILRDGLDSTKVYFSIKSEYPDTGAEFERKSSAVTLNIINYTPTLNPIVWDTNPTTVALTAGAGAETSYKLVKYFSVAEYDPHAKARKGAEIASMTIKNGSRTNTTATGSFDNIISSLFTFTATDDFGRTVSADYELGSQFINYVKLTCSSASASEMTADGDVLITVKGKYFSGSFGAQNNTLSFSYVAVPYRGDELTGTISDVSLTTSGSDYTATFTISGLSYSNSYNITITATDKLMTKTSGAVVVAPTPLFDWGSSDFNFNIPVIIQGGKVPTIIEQGTHWSGWNYRKWNDGTAECWRTLEVTTAVATATNASWYSSGELSATNLSFPFEFISRPMVTVQTMPTGTSWCIVFPSNTGGSTSTTGTYQLNSMSSTSSRKHLLAYHVKGYWY